MQNKNMPIFRLPFYRYCLPLLTAFLLLCSGSGVRGQISNPEFSRQEKLTEGAIFTQIDSAIARASRKKKQYPDSIMQVMDKLFALSRQNKYDAGMVRTLLLKAHILINFRNEENATPALALLRDAQQYLPAALKRDPSLQEKWAILMGAAFAKLSRHDSAMLYYTQGLNIGLRKKNPSLAERQGLSINYISLTSIFFEMGQFTKARYYAGEAARLALADSLWQQLYRSYMLTAGIFTSEKNTDSAGYYLEQLRTIPYRPEPYDIKVVQEYTGNYYLLLNDPDKAIAYYKKSVAATDNPSPMALKGMGRAYKMLGQYQAAATCFKTSARLLEEVESSSAGLISDYNYLAEVYDSLRDFKQAYEYKFLAYRLQEQLDQKYKTNIINKLEGQYRKAEQDKQLARNRMELLIADKKLNQQKILILGIAFLVLLFGALSIALFQKQKLQRQKLKTAEQDQEIEKLKTGIAAEEKERSRIGRELHDDIMVQLSIVKMNLEALPAQVPGIEKVNDFISLKEQLTNAGRDLRQTAHNLSPDTLLADGLTQALLYFLKNVQYRTRININFQYYGEPTVMPQENEMNIYRIVQELIQNIIKHAHAGNILVQLSYQPDMLTLTIEDDGQGFDAGDEDRAGIGLKSIRSRLKVMNGNMEILSRKPKGTSVTIEVYN